MNEFRPMITFYKIYTSFREREQLSSLQKRYNQEKWGYDRKKGAVTFPDGLERSVAFLFGEATKNLIVGEDSSINVKRALDFMNFLYNWYGEDYLNFPPAFKEKYKISFES